MQTLFLAGPRSAAGAPPAQPHLDSSIRPSPPSLFQLRRPSTNHFSALSCSPPFHVAPPRWNYSLLCSQFFLSGRTDKIIASASASTPYSSSNGESEAAKLAQVAKRLESTSRYFKRLGSFAFWSQLICTLVAAVILSFSVVVTGKITSPATFYATAGGIAAAFISVFWAFGYLRLSDKLRRTANEPSRAPPRADVVRSLKNGIAVNLLGMGAAILGLQATVGLLVAKALTTSANPYYQGIPPGSSPVLALDVFLVQSSANTILSHFLGLATSLELLRSVTLPPAETIPVAKAA